MRVELLVVPQCPNGQLARERLRDALAAAGRAGTPVAVRVITEATLASAPAFGGSPTILVDGVDPFADQVADSVGLSCRVYRTDAGLSGAPSVDALRRVLSD